MITDVWGRIDAVYDLARRTHSSILPVDESDDRVVVLGRYRGSARDGETAVDAAFAHVITVQNGDQITALQQITDTAGGTSPPEGLPIQLVAMSNVAAGAAP